MTSDIEEKALQEAAERKAEAKQRKAEAKAKKKALRQAKKAKTNAAKQKAIDAARSTGYSGRLVLLNEESELVKKSNSEALAADVEIRKLKATAKADKKAAKRAARANKKLAKMKAKSAIRATGWTRPVIMMNQESKVKPRNELWEGKTLYITPDGEEFKAYWIDEAGYKGIPRYSVASKTKSLVMEIDDYMTMKEIVKEIKDCLKNGWYQTFENNRKPKSKPKTVRKKVTAKSKPVKKKSTKRVR